MLLVGVVGSVFGEEKTAVISHEDYGQKPVLKFEIDSGHSILPNKHYILMKNPGGEYRLYEETGFFNKKATDVTERFFSKNNINRVTDAKTPIPILKDLKNGGNTLKNIKMKDDKFRESVSLDLELEDGKLSATEESVTKFEKSAEAIVREWNKVESSATVERTSEPPESRLQSQDSKTAAPTALPGSAVTPNTASGAPVDVSTATTSAPAPSPPPAPPTPTDLKEVGYDSTKNVFFVKEDKKTITWTPEELLDLRTGGSGIITPLGVSEESLLNTQDVASEILSEDPEKLYNIKKNNPTLYNKIIPNPNKNRLEYYVDGRGDFPQNFKTEYAQYQELLQEKGTDLSPEAYGELIRLANEADVKPEEKKKYEAAIKKAKDPLLLLTVLKGEEQKQFSQGLQCKGSGFISSMACALKPTRDENKLVDEKAVEILNKVQKSYGDKLKEKKKECAEKKSTCPGVEEYNKLIDDEIEKFSQKCKTSKCVGVINKLKEKLEPQKRINTNTLFDIVTAITNPDYNSLKAAKLFGFESNFDNVPSFLKEEFPSQICIAKIEGYLDKERKSSGGVTKYGCSETKDPHFDFNRGRLLDGANPNCLQVLTDLRAQRTRTTPDGKTAISYSYFLKGPQYGKVFYLLAISYSQGGKIRKVAIADPKELKNGSVAKGFEEISLPINKSLGTINENTFQIGIVSVFEDKRPYITLTYPVVFIEDGDFYYDTTQTTGNVQGNSLARSQQGALQQSLNTQDMLQLFN